MASMQCPKCIRIFPPLIINSNMLKNVKDYMNKEKWTGKYQEKVDGRRIGEKDKKLSKTRGVYKSLLDHMVSKDVSHFLLGFRHSILPIIYLGQGSQ